MTVTLAFYVGRGTWVDRAIRMATQSVFSHVELLAPYEGRPRSRRSLSISASPRDGGVRIKEIDFEPARWSFVDLSGWAPARPFDRARAHVGAGYDWRAIALSHALALGCQSENRFTCSELIGRLLCLRRPHLLSPADLYDQVRALNRAYETGRSTVIQGPL